jgi:hypothetical protein
MRKQLLLVVIAAMGCYNVLIAQQKVADSLMNVLRSHTQNDTAKVNLINGLAQETRRSNPKLADSLVETALRLSFQLNYKKGKGRALTIKANRYFVRFPGGE